MKQDSSIWDDYRRIPPQKMEVIWRTFDLSDFNLSDLEIKRAYFVGDETCDHNAQSPYIRCAINPCGPCEGCVNCEPHSLQP
jgi:hypothetical protein